MNKKIIAASVAAAFVMAAPAAQAEIKVYSMIQFELTDIDFGEGGAEDNLRVSDNQRGRLGVKGGHDLGGGLKSFAVAEFDFEGSSINNGQVPDAEFGNDGRGNGRAGFRVREINAGLKGAFGSIALGTIRSAYKYMGGVKYDPYVATQLEQRKRGGMSGGSTGHNGFLNNGFVYTGKFGIAKVHATYSLDDSDRDGDGLNNDDGELSAGVSFGSKKWEAGIALYDQGLNNGNNSTEAVKLFGKFKFGTSTILAQFEDVDETNVANSEYIMIGYQLKLGKGMISAYYGERDRNQGANDSENITIAYMHKFNKKSRVWVGYQEYDVNNGTASDRDSLSLGIRVDI